MFTKQSFLESRLLAAGIHLGVSLAVALLAAAIVFGVWYPYPYREISGGRDLFLLLVAVDVVMGPLLTLAIFDRRKPNKVLRRDLTVIGLLQMAALAYGLWTMMLARPVHLVFELERFRVVHAVDVPPESLVQAPAEFQRLPLAGPTLLSLREFKDSTESFDTTMAAVQGLALSAQPQLWQSYQKAKEQVVRVSRPLAELKTRFPSRVTEIDAALKTELQSHPIDVIGYVPMVGRQTFWTAFIDTKTAEVIAFVPIDSF
ncbi:TfpX/TfpZ family type IV pilin accessory protein [Polaromonas aquatica]|uniref:TfpX/TfpZ family type IV pilin accessory protein n=1 Tax=Polaromonas aquatica TaxID=332657 RepID=UPI003D65A297